MGQVGLLRRVSVVVLAVLVCLSIQSAAQQAYEDPKGFVCTDATKKSCKTYVLYRAQSMYSTIPSIATLFHANQSEVARISRVPVNKKLNIGDPVFVPVSCGCHSGRSYANISYTIANGDIFYNLATISFESLFTVTGIEAANPQANVTNLIIGEVVAAPVGCACPSNQQAMSKIRALVTYPIVKGDSVGQIASEFGVPSTSILTANELVGANSQLSEESTLLVPINTSLPHFTAIAAPPLGNSTPPPESPASPAPSGKSSGKGLSTGVYIAIAVGASAAVVVLLASCCCLFWLLRRKRKANRDFEVESPVAPRKPSRVNSPSNNIGPAAALGSGGMSSGDPLAGMADLVDSDRPAVFSYDELKDATDNFSDSSKLQGSVYRGILRGQVLAIKQMKGSSMSQELKILCRVHHTNLVKLVGICVTEAEDLYLVYEYAENGSLSDCLHTDFLSKNKLGTKSSSFLSWTMRVQVALDAASGLEYIHDYVNPSYVHKDVKSSNILLDSAFRAKIANFAMAKSGGSNNAMMTRHIAGTYGYMAPEYLAHGLVTTKADVFAFGVVLLELLSGQEAISEDSSGEEACLYSAIRPILESDDSSARLREWMDPILERNYPLDTAKNVASLAKTCVETDPTQRPSMKDITFALSNLLSATMEWETSSVFANTLKETPIEAR